jgi:hypothetical protein
MITHASLIFSLGLFAVFSLPIDNAKAADLPSSYTCDDLRTKVAEYGPSLILASARSRGFSENEIRLIRNKCRV